MYEEASKGKKNAVFNFLMLATACAYPGEYHVPADAFYSDQDPWAAEGIVSQLVTWLATDRKEPGFQGPPEGADPAAVNAAFLNDLAYFRNSAYYQVCLPNSLTYDPDPGLRERLLSEDIPPDLAAFGLNNRMDKYFLEIWYAAYFTSLLQPDWHKEIMKANTPMEQKDGEYHVYLDLFANDSAKLYLDGIAYEPYGDWERLGMDEETGKYHFKSASGELDGDNSIGRLYWPEGKLGAFLPLDITKAKILTFDTYNSNASDPDFGRIQTQFAAWGGGDLNIYVTIGEDDPEPGDFEAACERFEHTENFTATYNVNLLKYDSETGKPLAGSRWDVLEKFDDSQLGNTDLDRVPDNPGSYQPGLGSLNSTPWGG